MLLLIVVFALLVSLSVRLWLLRFAVGCVYVDIVVVSYVVVIVCYVTVATSHADVVVYGDVGVVVGAPHDVDGFVVCVFVVDVCA